MPNKEIFADIHCHTLLKYVQSDVVDLWEPIGKPNFFESLFGIVRYTAADFQNMAKGEVQIACVALTPPEQKTLFFPSNVPQKAVSKFSSFISRIPSDRIKQFQSENYDHYELLKREKALYIGGQNISGNVKVESAGGKTKCRFKVVKNYAEIESILNANEANKKERIIAVVFTVESAHALGTAHVEFNGNPNKFNVSEEVLLRRVDALKGIGSPEEKAWEQAPIWVTMTHAFNNGICGHAQPLDKLFRKLLDYSEPFSSSRIPPKYQACMNTGFTPMGKNVLERLLGIDAVSLSRPDPGKRILIDIKHMSTLARKEYYEIIEPYNAANPGKTIPIVMSHAAVNGKPSLDEDGYNPGDTDEDYENSSTFSPWSINLYDDEIIKIHQTKGLIGLIFYEPILGGKKRRKGMFLWSEKKWAALYSDQIEHIVKTAYNSGAADKKEIWNRICIGSDFDGQINPPNKFASSDHLPDFKKALIRFLYEDRFDAYRDKSEVEELAHKICFGNVADFLKKNF